MLSAKCTRFTRFSAKLLDFQTNYQIFSQITRFSAKFTKFTRFSAKFTDFQPNLPILALNPRKRPVCGPRGNPVHAHARCRVGLIYGCQWSVHTVYGHVASPLMVVTVMYEGRNLHFWVLARPRAWPEPPARPTPDG